MAILEKIKRSLFYDGLTKEEYKSVEPYIVRENNRRLRIYNVVGFAFVLGITIYSIFTYGMVPKTLVYLVSSLLNLGAVFLLYSKYQNIKAVSDLLKYFFLSLMLFFTVFVGTVKYNGYPATIFFAAFAIIPYIVYSKVFYGFIYRLIVLVAFIILSYISKKPEYVRIDIINSVCVFLLCTLAGRRVQKLQVQGWLMANRQSKEMIKMSGFFESVRFIDLQTNTSVDYSTDDNDNERHAIARSDNAIKQLEKYIEDEVCDANKIRMRQFCDLSTLEDRLYQKKNLILDYGTKDVTWRRLTFVPIGEDEKGFPVRVVMTIQRIADSFYLGMLDFDLKKVK